MTTSDNDPTDEQDQRAVPPYEGRRATADVDTDPEVARKDGANVGGATGPVVRAETAESARSDNPHGISPAQEQPASQTPDAEPTDEGVGPAHTAGVPKGESHADGE